MRGIPNVPWLEATGGAAALRAARQSGRYSAELCRQLECWRRWGYCLLPGAVPRATLEALRHDVDDVWQRRRPIPRLVIEQLRIADQGPGVLHRRLTRLPASTRARLRAEQPWRIHSFEEHSASALAIRDSPPVLEAVRAILGHRILLLSTITFMYGSEQALHQDVAVSHISPYRYLVGAWVACEDIHPRSGPLVYQPGSLVEMPFASFPDYPRTSLHNCDAASARAYGARVRRMSRRYPKRRLICRAGDVLLWHGMLLHGGSQVLDRSRTRRSFVSHYTIDGADRSQAASGPFNW